MKQLYVNNELIDLYQNTIIAQTLQVFDPGRPGSIVTNYTASVKVPMSHRNNQILEFINNSKTKTDLPYVSLPCRYVENGIPIIRDGRVVITDVNDQYSLSIYSGPWGFFASIQDRMLWSLDFSDINGPWTDSARDGYRNATTGIVQALVDDGRLEQDNLASAPVIENIGGILKPPQIYYHTVIEKIFQGFEVQGDIFSNDIFKKIVLPLSVIYNDPNFINSKMFSASAPGGQIIVDPVTPVAIIFNQNVQQGSDNFYDGNSEYIVVNPDTAADYFRLVFLADITITVVGGTINLTVDGITGSTPSTGLGSGTHSIGSSIGGRKDGDVIRITVESSSGNPTVSILAGRFYTMPMSGADGFEFFPTISSGYVYFNKLFTATTILDFLKDFCVRFNVQITQVNNVLLVNTMNSILDVRSGPDWTAKRNKGPNRILHFFSTYGRRNIFKSKINSDFTPDLTSDYGSAEFEIENENIKESFTVYPDIFEASQMITTFGVFMLNLFLEPNVANFARMPGNRLFFVRGLYATDPPALYSAMNRTDYLIGYYFDPDQEYRMNWDFFIETFHQKFIDRCLKKVRFLERQYNLTDLDIFKFNQQIPIWDDGERFLVTKIINRVSGKVAKVELLKVESNPKEFFVQGNTNELSADLIDAMEIVADDVPFVVYLRMSLIENITGSPEWQCLFDTTLLYAIGDGSFTEDNVTYVSSIATHVYKLSNDGNGTDGWPVVNGWVEWKKNGVQVHADSFNNSEPSEDQDLDYTYTGLNIGDELEVIVHEDGTSP